MANTKISALTALTGANLATDDAFAIVDTSATATKKITVAELKLGIMPAPGPIGATTPSTAAFTTMSATTGAAVGGATAGVGGLAFPATAVAVANANTLDDYEEGTWTPTIIGLSTAGTASYTNQLGYYTKIGNCVNFWARVSWSSANGTGAMAISPLPFTAAIQHTPAAGAFAMAAGDTTSVFMYGAGSSTYIQFYKYSAGVSTSLAVNATGDVIVTGHFFV